MKTARTDCLARSQPHLNTQLYLNYKGTVRLAFLTGDKCRSLSKCECINYKDSITRDLIVKFLLTLGSITLLQSEQMSLMILDPKHQIESFKFQIWKKKRWLVPLPGLLHQLPSRLWDHWGPGSLCEHQGALCSWLCSTTMIHAGNLGGEKHNVKTGAFQMYHLDSRWCNLCHNETPSVSCTVTFTLVYIFHLQPLALQNFFPSTSNHYVHMAFFVLLARVAYFIDVPNSTHGWSCQEYHPRCSQLKLRSSPPVAKRC